MNFPAITITFHLAIGDLPVRYPYSFAFLLSPNPFLNLFQDHFLAHYKKFSFWTKKQAKIQIINANVWPTNPSN